LASASASVFPWRSGAPKPPHLLDDSLVGGGGLNRQFLGQQKIPPVSLGDFYHLAAGAQLGHVFFQDDGHE
jgi:hypothetical protein